MDKFLDWLLTHPEVALIPMVAIQLAIYAAAIYAAAHFVSKWW